MLVLDKVMPARNIASRPSLFREKNSNTAVLAERCAVIFMRQESIRNREALDHDVLPANVDVYFCHFVVEVSRD